MYRLLAFTLAVLLLWKNPALADDAFDLPPPADLGQLDKLSLWATQYYVFGARNSAEAASVAIIGKNDHSFDTKLKQRDWCLAGIEGTVSVSFDAPPDRGFNYDGVGSRLQTDCSPLFGGNPSINVNALAKTLYAELEADAPFGLGDTPTLRLMPYRSFAADRSRFPRSSVIFVPGLRGVKIKLANGTEVQHDGYLYSADVGSAIKQNHIDVFTGTDAKNPAPSLIKSRASATFDAYLVTDADIKAKLHALHNRQQQ